VPGDRLVDTRITWVEAHVLVLSAFPAPTEKTHPPRPTAFLVPGLYRRQLTIEDKKIARALSLGEGVFSAIWEKNYQFSGSFGYMQA
jgi:hypothetical protein